MKKPNADWLHPSVVKSLGLSHLTGRQAYAFMAVAGRLNELPPSYHMNQRTNAPAKRSLFDRLAGR